MFSKSSNQKVKFQDELHLDDYILENSVLQSKLQSKLEALSIMGKELDKCSMERDRYKLLVEQLKCKNFTPEKISENNMMFSYNPSNSIRGGELLATTRAQNNHLKLEVETLRAKLDDALGDIRALRKQIEHEKLTNTDTLSMEQTYTSQDHEKLVQQLEKMKLKYQQIQLDYRATCDEKEEIVSDREYYKSKVQRLNQQISYILSNRSKTVQNSQGDPPLPIVDIDALVTENKYLHERITQLQVEKEIIKRTLTKYKTLLENRNKNDSLNLKKGFIDVMTQKQVREFLDKISNVGLKKSSAMELKSLCLGLFEALSDKSIALQHQRKTNQILASRVSELEKTLESWCNGQKYMPVFPSQMLIEEFLTDPRSNQEEINKQSDQDINTKRKYSDSDDEGDKTNSDISTESKNDDHVSDQNVYENEQLGSKTVLPLELEELVKEALAELKPAHKLESHIDCK